MITLTDYWMGRDKEYAKELNAATVRAAEITVKRTNLLLAEFRYATGDSEQRKVSSGWRPSALNASTLGASLRSKHIIGQAIDVSDPEGDLDTWCMDHLDTLARIGLWLEHPAATKGWCHLQTLPPKSGNRVFYP